MEMENQRNTFSSANITTPEDFDAAFESLVPTKQEILSDPFGQLVHMDERKPQNINQDELNYFVQSIENSIKRFRSSHGADNFVFSPQLSEIATERAAIKASGKSLLPATLIAQKLKVPTIVEMIGFGKDTDHVFTGLTQSGANSFSLKSEQYSYYGIGASVKNGVYHVVVLLG